MLVKLDSASTAVPVTLDYSPAIPATNDPLTIIGYGATVELGPSNDQLLKGTVNAVSSTDCTAFWGTRVDTTLQVCAGVTTGAVDICEGDEGGPLLTPSGTQVGIISYTNGCGRANTPAVFTRIR
jgi:secreted trypsin-like serine protease